MDRAICTACYLSLSTAIAISLPSEEWSECLLLVLRGCKQGLRLLAFWLGMLGVRLISCSDGSE